jgi:hypothetical protein
MKTESVKEEVTRRLSELVSNPSETMRRDATDWICDRRIEPVWFESVALRFFNDWMLSNGVAEFNNVGDCEKAMRELGAVEIAEENWPSIEGAEGCQRMFAMQTEDGEQSIHVVWIR